MNKKRFFIFIMIVFLLLFFGIYFHQAYSVPVLMYHSISPVTGKTRLSVSPEAFEKQMQFLKNNHYQVLKLDEYVDLLNNKQKPKQKAAVITFDDGYENNYSFAYPVLKKYKIPATIFMVVGWVGKEGMMNWQQLAKLNESGLIEIESHSLTHPELTKLNVPSLIGEIKLSKQILEEKLKKEVKYFCYPYGFYNSIIKEAVRLFGYKGACATQFKQKLARKNDVFALRRIRISQSADNLFIFWVQVSGYYTFLKDLRL